MSSSNDGRAPWGAALLSTILACSGAGASASVADDGGTPDFPESALFSLAAGAGRARVEIRTAPEQPPTHGVLSVEYRFVDASNEEPIDGLSLEVTPWMSAMGHGSSVKPSIVATGGGRYVAKNVNAFMPGNWELRTTVSGVIQDSLTPILDVP